ncbi:MAG: GLPGLI family protein [Chitinophagaceae bacterium]|nr:GLPGLI family protein [Chitinophagaceae bacterium]
MKKTILILTTLFQVCLLQAQTAFFSQVKIEYEKTVAVPALFREMEPSWFERIKDRLPQESKSYFEFIADNDKSVFKPGKEMPYDPRSPYQPMADKNVVYTDYSTSTSISQKPVFEETFLVTDSLVHIKWKITNDTRVIAGFECRKAIGILYDTIAVFAFYSDQIMIPGGPEGIQGLPGMILGMGIPRLHTTWFATKVEVNNVPVSLIVPAKKGKKTNRTDMLNTVRTAMKDWSSYGQKMLLAFMI